MTPPSQIDHEPPRGAAGPRGEYRVARIRNAHTRPVLGPVIPPPRKSAAGTNTTPATTRATTNRSKTPVMARTTKLAKLNADKESTMTQAIGSPGNWRGRVSGATIVNRPAATPTRLRRLRSSLSSGASAMRSRSAVRQAASPRAARWFGHVAMVAL